MKKNSKKVSLTLLLVLAALCIKAQNQVVSIGLEKMKTFYIGVDNPVTIAVSGIAAEKVNATIDRGTINGKNGTYVVNVSETVSTFIEITADGKKISRQEFTVKRIPNPLAYVGGFGNNASISREQLEKIDKVSVEIINFPFDLKYKVVSFAVTLAHRDKSKDPVEISNHQYTNDDNEIKALKEVFKQSEPGDKIYFEYIKAMGPDGIIRMIEPINMSIN